MNAFMQFVIEESARQKLSQAELAALADLGDPAICHYFKGDREPRTGNLNKMLNALGYELAIVKMEV